VLTPFTKHAEIRAQQRGIRYDVLDCLLAYGRREHDHAHCEIVYFDARAAERAHREAGPRVAHLVSDHRDVYAVIDSDGRVVTTGHRFRRILRDKSQSNLRPGRARRTMRPNRPSRPRPPFVDLLSAAV
jgi:PAS domain-containing protein